MQVEIVHTAQRLEFTERNPSCEAVSSGVKKQRRYSCKTTCRRRRPVEFCLGDEMPSGPRLEIALPRAAISHAFAHSIRVLAGSKGYQQERFVYWHLK